MVKSLKEKQCDKYGASWRARHSLRAPRQILRTKQEYATLLILSSDRTLRLLYSEPSPSKGLLFARSRSLLLLSLEKFCKIF